MVYEIKVLDIELEASFPLPPSHDRPVRVESGRIVSRVVDGPVPGPEQAVEHRTSSETREMGLGAGRCWA